MKTGLKFGLLGFLCLCLYLLLWPIPLSPQAWNAPENRGLTGDFTPNHELADLNFLSIGDRHGPEDVVVGNNGLIYVSTQDGDIIEIDPAQNTHRLYSQTGGVPLGLEFDTAGNLLVADAHKGLLSINPTGEVSVLTNEANGQPILYADDVDIGPDGNIYFTDASTKFGAKASGTTLKGSIMEIFEHGRTGRILAYDPNAKESFEIATNLSFPNGIAVEPDGSSLLYIETGEYRLMRLYIRGARLGEVESVYENFPGFPDNINRAPDLDDGTPSYFVGLVSPRNAIADKLSGKPFLRKIIWRLPAFMRPQAEHYSHLLRIDTGGKIIASWQDPKGGYPLVTGGAAVDGRLYLSSLGASKLGYRTLPD